MRSHVERELLGLGGVGSPCSKVPCPGEGWRGSHYSKAPCPGSRREGSLYGEVQCIMGNDHMGIPPGSTE